MNTNLCEFCKDTIETASHLFWDCVHVSYFWQQIGNLIAEYVPNFNREVITKENVFFNTIQLPVMNLSNFIVLMAKQYIYRQNVWIKNYPLSSSKVKCILQKTWKNKMPPATVN